MRAVGRIRHDFHDYSTGHRDLCKWIKVSKQFMRRKIAFRGLKLVR